VRLFVDKESAARASQVALWNVFFLLRKKGGGKEKRLKTAVHRCGDKESAARALGAFTHAIRLDPEDAASYIAAARTHRKDGNVKRALALLKSFPADSSNAAAAGTYADVCWRMLTYADVCWRMLTYAGVCWRMLAYADVCWRMLTYADVC